VSRKVVRFDMLRKPLCIVLFAAGATVTACSGGNASADPAQPQIVVDACKSYAELRPLLADVKDMDQRAVSGDSAGAGTLATEVHLSARRAEMPDTTDNPALSARANEFVWRVRTFAHALEDHSVNYAGNSATTLLEVEAGLEAEVALIDQLIDGTSGQSSLCPAFSAGSGHS
jgi:hypothetical protein